MFSYVLSRNVCFTRSPHSGPLAAGSAFSDPVYSTSRLQFFRSSIEFFPSQLNALRCDFCRKLVPNGIKKGPNWMPFGDIFGSGWRKGAHAIRSSRLDRIACRPSPNQPQIRIKRGSFSGVRFRRGLETVFHRFGVILVSNGTPLGAQMDTKVDKKPPWGLLEIIKKPAWCPTWPTRVSRGGKWSSKVTKMKLNSDRPEGNKATHI